MNKILVLLCCVVALLFTSCNPAAKDEPNTIPNTISDIDGNVYHSVTIGTQTWMVENLKTTKYRNGELIGNTSPATKDISKELAPKYQWAYDGNEANVAKYGRLYTWYAVSDSRNIAPMGWHVATDTEWTTLGNYVNAHIGNSITIAKALAATTDWGFYTIHTYIPTIDSIISIGNKLELNNSTGFSAVPSGKRNSSNSTISPIVGYIFNDIGGGSYWWTTSEQNQLGTSMGLFCLLGNSPYQQFMCNFGASKSDGYSVRCVKD